MTELTDAKSLLGGYRVTIDNLDAALINILAERFRCTHQVGVLKAKYQLPPTDLSREHDQRVRIRSIASRAGLDPVLATRILSFIIKEVVENHKAIATDQVGSEVAAVSACDTPQHLKSENPHLK